MIERKHKYEKIDRIVEYVIDGIMVTILIIGAILGIFFGAELLKNA